MADLTGKTFVITGASSGIGKITAIEIAKQGARVIVACRNRKKSEPVRVEIERDAGAKPGMVELIDLDLGDLSSVRRCADELLAKGTPIHGLINNAGLAGARGLTKDGFELAFGTNHLGHYLLTRLLLPLLEKAGDARIVNVSSKSHYSAKKLDWNAVRKPTKTITALREYEVSKLANVLFTAELARQLEGKRIHTYAVHPGVVATDAWRRLPGPLAWLVKKLMISPEQGAVASIRCATAPELANDTGKYYTVGGVERAPSRLAQDRTLARELWQKSAEWTGLS